MYQITLKGDTSAAQARIGDQPWVSHLRAETAAATVGGQTTLEIAVTDEVAAEARLLGLLVDDQCSVIAFGRKARSLEEAFVRLMEGEPHGR